MKTCTYEEAFVPESYTQDISVNAPVGIFTTSPEGRFSSANAALAKMFGYESQEKLITSVWDIAAQLYADPADREDLKRLLEEHGEVVNHKCRFRRRDGTEFWGQLNVYAARDEKGKIADYHGCTVDITEHDKSRETYKQLEWMLSGKPVSHREIQEENHDQGYGDLTELNRDGLILKTIGRERLEKFADEYLELLGTSSAIYEVNGDYAYGIFSSGWCRMMDRASRNLCDTADNAEALGSGRWLCHESCWTECSRRAIAEGAPVDIACSGGIRMYAVPILAYGKVVGAINFGYGDPPDDPETLRKLAEAYQLDFDDLVCKARSYKSRPLFIIELAKKRLHASARIIGSMIETKQAEEIQRKNEETLHATLRSIGDAVISTDMNGCIVSMNPVAESLTGWSSREAAGQPLENVFCIINEHTRQPVESPVSNVLESGQIVGLANHTLLIAKDGREVPIADSGAPIRNRFGETTGVVLVFRDQSNERAARKALEERERRFQKMFGVVPDMISIHNPEMDILYSNWNGFAAVPESMRRTGTKCYKTYRDKADICPDCLAESVLKTRKPVQKEIQLPDGNWVDIRVIPILDENNHVEMFMEWVRDITEHKQAEESLLKNRDMMDTTQRLARIGSWEWNVERQTMSWTDEVYRIHDLEPGELEAGSLEHIRRSLACYDPKDRPVIQETFRCCMEEGKPYDLEVPFTTVRGQQKWVRTAAQAVMEENRIVKVIGSIMDITERKKAERALRRNKEQSDFLAETAFELVELTSIQEIYAYAVQKLYHLFNANALVALVEYNQSENRWKMQHTAGIGKKAADLSRLFGFDINRMEGEISTKYYQQITSGKVSELAFDFPGLFNNKLSAAVGSAVKKLFSVDKMYCIAFQEDEHIMGNVTIITLGKTESINTILIEAFIQQVTTFVKKQKAEDNIREKDSQFRKLSANLPDLIYQFTRRPDGTYYVPIASEGINNIFGCRPGDVADNFDAIARVLHPDDVDRVIGDIEYSAEHLTYFTCEFRVLIPGRPVQWILSRSNPEKLPDGSVTWYGFNANITQQKQVEQALRESEVRFKALHNASFGGITIHDKGLILECNQGLADITGFSYDELIGMDGLLLIAQRFRETVRKNIQSGYEKPYEVLGLRKNGEEYPLRLEARNIPYKGKLVRVVEFRDITEQKQAEEENGKLQEQLSQSRKMDSVGRLAGGVAHDFNNMLSVIIGYAELILEKVDTTNPVHRDVREILKAANRSAELTRQLLAFSRKQTIAPKVLAVNETIEQTLNLVRKLIGEDIVLAWMPGPSVRTILLDPSQLDQVITNLCINARDAINTTGKITIETAAVEFDEEYCYSSAGFTPGKFVLLAVSDNGCGMDRDTAEKIFEPFFSLKGDRGTGLGMSTVYGIVQQNNGFINVYSEIGKGTTIKIYFPEYAEAASRQEAGHAEEILKGQGQTILLVEDEKAIREMVQSVLERLGYHVLSAETPGKAIRLADTHCDTISLLLTDVVMPDMNGRELSERLQKLCPKLQTLFMSGYTANVIAHQGVLDKGIQFMQKPFSVKELSTKVSMILQQN